MTDVVRFRQQLEAVLRTRDIQQVSEFLIAEKQWIPGTAMPDDPDFAMWMMIAGNAHLRDLHEQARQWLVNHGHAEEATMLVARGKGEKAKRSRAPIVKKGR
ncbi:MAG TPA: hypothetical protein VGT44_11725 [Ktedonobacteraceae bacterium]|nr:hypothetical protein [Ktedonobacteraceae bacterium]